MYNDGFEQKYASDFCDFVDVFNRFYQDESPAAKITKCDINIFGKMRTATCGASEKIRTANFRESLTRELANHV
jgi:hypothetical protein